MKRQRGRARRPNHGNRSFESNGPDIKIRGTANQIHEKYLQYARDAHSSGDRVRSENFFQHAEHYYRLMALNGLARDRRSDEDDSANNEQPADTRNHDTRNHNVGSSEENSRRRNRTQQRNRRPRPERQDHAAQPDEPPVSPRATRSALDALAEEQATVSES